MALILLAAIVAFGASVTHGFVYDDFSIFTDPVVTSNSGWWEVWGLEHTRPLTFWTFWANFQLSGQDPFSYHLINVALHLGCVALVYVCLRKLLGERTAQLAALLFAVHPLAAEPVNYIFARASLLMTLFCLLSLREWLTGRHWLAVVWFATALLSKEECVAFPVFLGLLHLSISRNRKEHKALAVMIVLAILAGARVWWAANHVPGSQAGANAGILAGDYFWTQGLAILRYLKLLIVPVGFSVEAPFAPMNAWWAWLILVGAVAVAARRFDRAREGFWLIGGLVLLLPSSSIFPASDLAADRRMYFPLMAFGAALALLLARWHKYVVPAIALVLIPVSILRTQVWAGEDTLWADVLAHNPASVRARIHLARISPIPERTRLLEEAKKNAPDDPLVASELGSAYLSAGDAGRALGEFGRALALAPNDPNALSNRAVALLNLGQRDAGVADLKRALQIDPCLWEARYNLKRVGVAMDAAANCRYSPELQQILNDVKP